MGDCYFSMNFSVLPETPQAETTQSCCQGTHLPTVVGIHGKVAHRPIGPQAQLTGPPPHRPTGSPAPRLNASPPHRLASSPAHRPPRQLTGSPPAGITGPWLTVWRSRQRPARTRHSCKGTLDVLVPSRRLIMIHAGR